MRESISPFLRERTGSLANGLHHLGKIDWFERNPRIAGIGSRQG